MRATEMAPAGIHLWSVAFSGANLTVDEAAEGANFWPIH